MIDEDVPSPPAPDVVELTAFAPTDEEPPPPPAGTGFDVNPPFEPPANP